MRALLAVGDRLAFETFLRLCAGRTGGLVNLSALGADAGVSHNTAKAWISVLEAVRGARRRRVLAPVRCHDRALVGDGPRGVMGLG